MSRKPKCVYYDCGHTAPKDFGAYCMLPYNPKKIEPAQVCPDCSEYIPEQKNFADWFEVNRFRLAQMSLRDALEVCWTHATNAERMKGK